MNNVLEIMLKKYEINNMQDKINAIKEIIQEIILCGLSRGLFFDVAAFYGGTALRIFYSLDRFSEDLDFALLKPNKDFDFKYYLSYVEREIQAYGLNMNISIKDKSVDANIKTAFIQGKPKEIILTFFPNENFQDLNNILKDIKIKLEVDVNPPMGANYEVKYSLLPSPYEIKLYDESSLFAGKIHAILCRNWNNRTKGRDLYDYIFFLANNIPVNMTLINEKLKASKVITNDITINELKEMLNNKFKEIDYENAKKDIGSFITNLDRLSTWNYTFFAKITNDLQSI